MQPYGRGHLQGKGAGPEAVQRGGVVGGGSQPCRGAVRQRLAVHPVPAHRQAAVRSPNRESAVPRAGPQPGGGRLAGGRGQHACGPRQGQGFPAFQLPGGTRGAAGAAASAAAACAAAAPTYSCRAQPHQHFSGWSGGASGSCSSLCTTGSRAAAGSGGSGGEKGTQAAAWPRRAAGGAAGVVCGGRVCCRCFFGHRCSRGGACGYTQATRVRACCCFIPLRLTALRRAQGGIRRPESVVPRLFRGAGLRPSELEAWTMWWCEASHVHATSSEGLHPSAACGLPKAPSWHPVPLDGAGWSLGAPVVVSGELGGPGKRSRALGTVSSGPPPRPGACQAVAVHRGGIACLCRFTWGRAAQRDLPLRSGGVKNLKFLFLCGWSEVGPSALLSAFITFFGLLRCSSFCDLFECWGTVSPNPLRHWGSEGVISA